MILLAGAFVGGMFCGLVFLMGGVFEDLSLRVCFCLLVLCGFVILLAGVFVGWIFLALALLRSKSFAGWCFCRLVFFVG